MQEIVPPKLNKDTGFLSLLLNRRNFLVFIGIGMAFAVWSMPYFASPDQRIFLTLWAGFILIPFLFDVHGRPLHIYIIDAIQFYIGKKQKKITTGRDISGGIVIIADNQFSRVYRIEPINLAMSSQEEIMTFKQYVQGALFALKAPIQFLTIQKHSEQDASLRTEIDRYQSLSGKLREQCEQYLIEYQGLKQTMERYFYLVLHTYAKGIDDARRKLDEQENSFGRLLEQTKIRLIPLNSNEVLELTQYLLPKKQ